MRRSLIAALAAFATLTLVSGVVLAGSSWNVPTNGVFYACYDSGGNVKFIDYSVTKKCPSNYMGPVQWNQTGSQGLPGPQGLQGPKGDKGDTGATGATGAKGDTGLTGATGAPGEDGLPGKDGVNGTNGIDGKDGAPGKDGVNGVSPTVAMEPAGTNCPNGGYAVTDATHTVYACNGAPGAKGDKGDTGATGAAGPVGPAGPAGSGVAALDDLAGMPCNAAHAAAGGTVRISYAPDGTITMTCAPTVMFTVNVTIAGDGGAVTGTRDINCTASCSHRYAYGQTVTLSADPLDVHHFFVGWSGACTGRGVCLLPPLASDRTVTATFIDVHLLEVLNSAFQSPYPVTVSVTAAAGSLFPWAGSSECVATPNTSAECVYGVVPGSVVTLHAESSEPGVFFEWTTNSWIDVQRVSDSEYQVTMNADHVGPNLMELRTHRPM